MEKEKVKETGPKATPKDTYTYGDYLNWRDDERWELIDGVPYNMTPAPSRSHQAISRELLKQIAVYLTGKPCEVYAAPFDVRLPEQNETDEQVRTVVQPDLVVICDQHKLDERGCKGAPDLAIEIISPFTVIKDLKIKFILYERAGVKEYWLVDPANKAVQVYRLGDNSRYGRPDVYSTGDHVKTCLLPDLAIDLAAVFSVA